MLCCYAGVKLIPLYCLHLIHRGRFIFLTPAPVTGRSSSVIPVELSDLLAYTRIPGQSYYTPGCIWITIWSNKCKVRIREWT